MVQDVLVKVNVKLGLTMETNKIQCKKCGIPNIHDVEYFGRVLNVTVTDVLGCNIGVSISERKPDSDDFLQVTCGICGYQHIDNVENKEHDDAKV